MKTTLEILEWNEVQALLADRTGCPLGRERALRLVPFREFSSLEKVAGLVREAMVYLGDTPGSVFGSVQDLRPLLRDARRRGTGLDGEEIAQCHRTLGSILGTRRRFARREECRSLHRRAQAIPDLEELHGSLAKRVDSDGSVLSSAHPDLPPLRRELIQREREVRKLADRVASRGEYRSVLRPGPPVLRDGRFMLAVRAESRGNVPGVLHDRSSSGNTVFVEPRELVEPQNRLADIRLKERNIEHRVLLECTRELIRHDGEIQEALSQIGSLDLVFARARWGVEIGATVARVEVGGSLQLRDARHPLLFARVAGDRDRAEAESVIIPFDLDLGQDFDVLVITGPNTGGKTVTLKTIGLLSFMALAAVPVTAASSSRFPFYDEVHADLGDEQDLQQNLSTFSGHLRRVSHILERATGKSLVLLDELGSGTDPHEGEALAHALLLDLEKRGAQVVTTTHLSGLKHLGFERDRIENASLEFDSVSLQPLYRLTLGLPGESNALTIARRHGIPPSILEAARARLYRDAGEESRKVAEGIQRSRAVVRERLERAEEEQRRAEDHRRDLEAKLSEVESRNQVLEEQKEAELDRVLESTRSEGLRVLEELGTVPRNLAPRLEAVREFLEGLPRKSGLRTKLAEFVLRLKRNDTVYLPRYRERCRVKRVDRSREKVTVIYRKMELEVTFSEIALPPEDGGGRG